MTSKIDVSMILGLGVLSVLSFGAKLDGATNDTLAIANSLAAQGVAYIPSTPTGFVAGNLTLGTNQVIFSDKKTIWTIPAGSNYGVRITADGAGTYATLRNFLFDGSLCPTSTTAIRFGTSTGIVYGVRGEKLDFRYCGEAIGQETHATNYIVDVMFTDCICYLTRGRQVTSTRSRGFITFRDFKIDHNYNTNPLLVTFESARFEDIIGLELEKFDVVGPANTTPVVYEPGSAGVVIQGTPTGKASVWLTRVLVDNTRGPGIVINNVFNLFSDMTCAYQTLGGPLVITDVFEAVFTNTSIAGAKGLTGSPGSVSGIVLERVTEAHFTNTMIKDVDGRGITLVDSKNNRFSSLNIKGCTGYGYAEFGTSDGNQVHGAWYKDNTLGNIFQIGATSVHTEWVRHPGGVATLTARTVGTADL